jgi:hypothetical protein
MNQSTTTFPYEGQETLRYATNGMIQHWINWLNPLSCHGSEKRRHQSKAALALVASRYELVGVGVVVCCVLCVDEEVRSSLSCAAFSFENRRHFFCDCCAASLLSELLS